MSEREWEYTAYVRGTVYASNLDEAKREVRRTIGQFSAVDIEDIEPVIDDVEEAE